MAGARASSIDGSVQVRSRRLSRSCRRSGCSFLNGVVWLILLPVSFCLLISSCSGLLPLRSISSWSSSKEKEEEENLSACSSSMYLSVQPCLSISMAGVPAALCMRSTGVDAACSSFPMLIPMNAATCRLVVIQTYLTLNSI
jgi:hypothetical protein